MIDYIKSIIEGVNIALYAIWANKTRAFLTTFGIIIGILSVTTMATVIDGINRGFDSSLKMLGTNVLYVQKWPWNFGANFKWWDYINRPEMKIVYVKDIEKYSHLASSVAASSSRNVNATYRGKTVNNVQIIGATVSYTQTSNIEIDKGRFFTEEENRVGRQVCVIGAGVSSGLFPHGYVLGKFIRVGGQKYEIIGILKKQGKFLGLMSFDNQIIVPINAFRKYYGLRHGLSIMVKYPSKKSMKAGQYELKGIMRRIRKIRPEAKDNFAINKVELFQKQYHKMTNYIYIVGFFLTALALFVGGIGVMNIMFVSVKERTKEIGIRKAVGAKFYQILSQFLIEAIIVCSLGGVIGILLSFIMAAIINHIFVAYMDWKTVIWAFAICAGTGILFGFLPAYRAAKSDPISSIRYE